MRIPPENIEIPREKISNYLLIEKERNDKSAFLINLGYSIDKWSELANDIKQTVMENEAYLQQDTAFGDIYEVRGRLRGLAVVTIWLLAIGSKKYRFVTLFPYKLRIKR